MPSWHRFAIVMALGLSPAGCGLVDTQAPPCDSAMPVATQLLARPELAPLQYYLRMDYDPIRGAGYDIWADSKFEYTAALQYSLVPHRASAREGGQYCARSIALRLAWPLNPARDAMLRAFIADAARSAALAPQEVEARIRDVISRDQRYRPVLRQGRVALEAGRVTHPNRGEFFVVDFGWPSP